MKTPGYTADRSICETKTQYQRYKVAAHTSAKVVAQARPVHFFDCLNRFLGGCLAGDARDCESLDACSYAVLVNGFGWLA